MSSDAQPTFGKLRSIFWPVHGFELKKLIPMFLMFFCILFNYTIMRDLKDSLIVTSAGAEAIPFLKLGAVLPGAIIYMLFYAKLSNVFSTEKLFYAAIVPFIIFFTIFPLVIFPNHNALHLHSFAETLRTNLPSGLEGMIGAIENWTFSLYYVMAELWGSAVISLLFWGFANEITRTSEAKRFYALFGMGGQWSLIASGLFIRWAATLTTVGNLSKDQAEQTTLNYVSSMVIFSAFAIIAIYYWMSRNILTDKRFYNPEESQSKKKKPKQKMSIKESFAFLSRSPYITCLAILVISYGVCINIVEVVWKSQVKEMYPNKVDYLAFMGGFSFSTGIASFIMIFIGGSIIRKLGWTIGALATPIMLGITGLAFFAISMLGDKTTGFASLFGTTPLFLAVILGAMQNIISKSTKYTLFDPTKEMAYIPLDKESKTKGKAAIDVVGARMGKSGGALINGTLLIIFGSLGAITPFLAIILVGVLTSWIFSSKKLGKLLTNLNTEKEKEKEKATEVANTEAAVVETTEACKETTKVAS